MTEESKTVQGKLAEGRTPRGLSLWPSGILWGAALLLLVSAFMVSGQHGDRESQVEPGMLPAQGLKTYELRGGKWWNGRTFKSKTLYSVDGQFVKRRPARVDEVLDLEGRYIVPPFGEAHNHNFTSSYKLETIHDRYLDHGIFYVRIANNIAEDAAPIRSWFDGPGRVDVAFSNGGVTASGGHPSRLYERVILPRSHPNKDPSWARDRAYFVVDELQDLEQVWPKIQAGQPDFLKIFILYSEEHQQRLTDAKYDGYRGLDPQLVPHIVRRAHDEGLEVASHIETAADFRLAVQAGVDHIMHLPGYRIPQSRPIEEFRLTAADARRAKRSGVTVVATAALSQEVLPDLDRFRILRETLAYNLRILHRRGVRLAVGSDRYQKTALDEIMTLHALEIFDNRTLLNLWCETGAVIFPHRRLGKLAPGYEASFLALGGNPMDDFQHVRDIHLRFKQGILIDP